MLPADAIVSAGLDHLTGVECTAFTDATRFRYGLIVASLALLTLMIGNFRDLEIGRSFLILRNGFDITLGPDETKNHRALYKTLPDLLHAPTQLYLEVYRPVLLSEAETPHEFLWVIDWGKRYAHSSLGARFTRLTHKMLGVGIAPHLVRDAAAATIARRTPARSRAIAGVLGHADLRTADRFYHQARSLDASRAYTPYIEELISEASSRTRRMGQRGSRER